MPGPLQRWIVALSLVAGVAGSSLGSEAFDSGRAADVKSAFIYSFATFTIWQPPPKQTEDLRVCLIGTYASSLEMRLNRARRKGPIGGRELSVHVLPLEEIERTLQLRQRRLERGLQRTIDAVRRLLAGSVGMVSPPLPLPPIDASPFEACHLVYLTNVGPGDSRRAAQAAGRGILLVGEGRSFVENGGAVSLAVEGRRIVFYVNRSNVHRAGLRLSSHMLGVANLVESD